MPVMTIASDSPFVFMNRPSRACPSRRSHPKEGLSSYVPASQAALEILGYRDFPD